MLQPVEVRTPIREFIDAVRNGIEPSTICTDKIKSLAMVFGAIESAETGEQYKDFKSTDKENL
jgi:hypothetical protein